MLFKCGSESFEIDLAHCIVAGWTGRDAAAIRHHIEELAKLGVAPPSEVPLYYRVAWRLLTQDSEIEVVGSGTSGEVEPLLVFDGKDIYLGLASDHTDRDLETHSVALSKQACSKPVADTLWRFDEVRDHLDRIELSSWIREGVSDEWRAYQHGTLGAIRPLADLIDGSGIAAMAARGGAAMLCGTLGVTDGGVRPARAFRMALRDPVLGRSINHTYGIVELPVVA